MSYTKQGNLTYSFEMDVSLTGATSEKILFESPSHARGEFPATIVGTTLVLQFTNDTILEEGEWTFQPMVLLTGLNTFGKKIKITFGKSLL